MKALKIITGTLVGVFTVAQVVFLALTIIKMVGGEAGDALMRILASAVLICVGGAISVALLQSAFKKRPESSGG